MSGASQYADQDAPSLAGAWRGYGLAVLAVAAGLLLRYLLTPLLGQQGPYLLLALSILLASLYGGFGPAILATVLGTLAGTYFFVGTRPGWEGVLEPPNLTRTLLFVAIGISISIIGGWLKASRQALAASVLELRKSNRAKDRVLATVAHEIRNPLSALASANQVLQRSAADPARVSWAADLIDRQVRQISRLADDLMDMSQVLHGRIDMQVALVDLRDVLRQAQEQNEVLLAGRQHRLTRDIPATPALVRGDASRLVQVFANLLNNAAKYTPEGGRITLALAPAAAGWQVRVADDGHGFDHGTQDELFEPFVQAPAARANEATGLGLGLAIVKRIVELHGGQVVAHSPGPGRGATFTVLLPATQAEVNAAPAIGDAATLRP